MEYRPIIAAQSTVRIVPTPAAPGFVRVVLVSNRYLLGIALILVALVPLFLDALHDTFRSRVRTDIALLPTYIASFGAVCLGHLSLRRIAVLPLVSGASLIFPTFLASFTVGFFVLFILRIPLGLPHLLGSFVTACTWYFFASVMRARYVRPIVGLVGVSPTEAAQLSDRIHWQILREPRLPQGISAVAFDPHSNLSMRWSSFITKLVLQGVPVYHLAHMEEGLTGRVKFTEHSDNEFGALLPSLFYLKIKRIIDVVVALLALPFVACIVALVSVLIRLESPGPAIFCQVRMGHRGRPFVCFKLRTMHTAMHGPAFTEEGDRRVTRLGAYLRKWRIDELPQVWNVALGEMSWIGPRPEAIGLARHYERHVPFYGYRHAVRPGITGWAAVHQGNVAMLEAAQEKLEFDFFYIRYFSFWLDVLIVLKTIRTVLTGFGSR